MDSGQFGHGKEDSDWLLLIWPMVERKKYEGGTQEKEAERCTRVSYQNLMYDRSANKISLMLVLYKI